MPRARHTPLRSKRSWPAVRILSPEFSSRGNATKDAEIHQSEGKVPYADFTLAVSRTEDQTTFFPVRLFGKLAETCENIKKGAKLLVDGKLDISEYTDKEGQKRMSFRILADTYRLF